MISLLVVNFHSAALAAEAVRSARESSGSPLQVVIVDNSCDPAEAEALRPLADTLIVSKSNRGYAGGINDGRRVCDGAAIVIANADVAFGDRSIDRLVEALSDAAVAGPALYWDSGYEWALPPGDLMTAREKLDEVLASRSRAWFEQRDRRRFQARVAFWSLADTTPVRMLSGALFAVRASDFDAAGGFDERFALYFEETDFLRRISAIRRRIVYVPAAKCRHMYNQSAGQIAGEAAARYAQSELRYLEKWNGPFLGRLLKRLERPASGFDAAPLAGALEVPPQDVVVEASPLPTFATAAGHFPRARAVEIPDEVWESVRTDVLYLRTVDRRSGNIVATYARYRS